ncbi:hypothetical protein VIAG107301_11005 [Vibrio agarivorans]
MKLTNSRTYLRTYELTNEHLTHFGGAIYD